MNTTKLNQSDIKPSSPQNLPVNQAISFGTHGNSQMCPPTARPGFVRVNESKRKNSGGGYTPMPHGLTVDETAKDRDTSASAYSDFILYNYGAAGERRQPSAPNEEQ